MARYVKAVHGKCQAMDPPTDLIKFSGVKRKYNKFRKSFPKEVIFNSKCHARFKVNEKCQIKVFHSTSLLPSPNLDFTYYTFSGPALFQTWDRCWNLMRNKMYVFSMEKLTVKEDFSSTGP